MNLILNYEDPRWREALEKLANFLEESTKEVLEDVAARAKKEGDEDIGTSDADVFAYMKDLIQDGILEEIEEDLEKIARLRLLKEVPKCPGCGCGEGEGITESCNHPDGCGFWKAVRDEASHS